MLRREISFNGTHFIVYSKIKCGNEHSVKIPADERGLGVLRNLLVAADSDDQRLAAPANPVQYDIDEMYKKMSAAASEAAKPKKPDIELDLTKLGIYL